MSWQKRSIQLILGLPLSLPIVSYAINIGDTYVQSQQNQPLNASINVTDINPATFSVKIANPDTYRQLGLSKDTDISVRFEQTSSNGGKIVLSSSQPVNSPFADVVLNVENEGSSKTLPKTLLMPINNTQTMVTQSNAELIDVEPAPIIIGQHNQIDLPKVNEDIKPKPPVSVTPKTEVIAQVNNVEPIQAPVDSVEPVLEQTLNAQSTENLKLKETRRIYPAGTTFESLPPLTEKPEETLQAIKKDPVKPTKTKPVEAQPQPNEQTTPSDTVIYVIQRNDNLWTIANQLAKKNNKNVNTVMKEIIAANPNAFPNNDPSKLRVNMELEVPRYEVMPSELGAKSATDAKQETDERETASTSKGKTVGTKQTTAKKTTKTTKHTTVHKQPTTKKPTQTTARKKSEMQIIAPSQKAGSAQGSHKTSKGAGTAPVVAQVEKKRQITAQKATKVSTLNQSLVDAEKRLKMQNAKLAQLEQRLKELNKK